ncbi:hypothetical protein [Streptomyces caniscabiei]|uniref:hypothetical protein n=1 Tax=Streptomyces caniscabiei TaxID=2746961 RepID=UPI0018725F77|nr:hypothetical protein [Streptomyces caniscabiei]MBE4796160.1 hypothetical protein [Streptomyces caniscabiei]MDX2944468.1 hypothetical protein [Streptomyces caniscabiei]
MTDTTETARLHDEILGLRAELATARDLLRSENQRANAAITREETAEEAALEAHEQVRRLSLMVDEYGAGASALTDKLRRVRELHRKACLVAQCKVPPTAFTCGLCDVLDAPASAVVPAADRAAPELTAEEARDLAEDLGYQLYRAQDALAFVGECCDIADREQRPVTTADVREWLKGARCGRQLLAESAVVDRVAAETEAHPAEHTWAAELHDPLADEWVPGTRYPVRDRAVNALNHAKRLGPTWKDGTLTERRLVRATTTYTVEEPGPVVEAQPGKDTETPQPKEA